MPPVPNLILYLLWLQILDGTSATEALAGYFGNAIDPRFIGPTDGLALLEEEARARDAAGPTFVSPILGTPMLCRRRCSPN
jgi:hypothetical protein